jgi:hypothetical protein
MPVNVAGQYGGEFARYVGMANHILSRRELEVHRPDRCALGGLMHAQHTHRRGVRLPLGLGDKLRKFRAHVAALARKSRQCQRRTARLDHERARTVEDVDVRMRGET